MPAISAASRPTPSRSTYELTVDEVEYLRHGGSPLLPRLLAMQRITDFCARVLAEPTPRITRRAGLHGAALTIDTI